MVTNKLIEYGLKYVVGSEPDAPLWFVLANEFGMVEFSRNGNLPLVKFDLGSTESDLQLVRFCAFSYRYEFFVRDGKIHVKEKQEDGCSWAIYPLDKTLTLTGSEEAFAMAYKFYETREIMGFNTHGDRL